MSAAGAPGARRLRVPVSALETGDFALAREAAVYVARVHRLAPGDMLTLFDPERAIEAEARIVAIAAGVRHVTVRVAAVRPAEVRAPRPVTLVQALGKGDKMDAIVRDATELGATRIAPVIAERSVVRPEESTARVERWRRIAIEAARQCGRGDVPRIVAPVPLLEAISAQARERANEGSSERANEASNERRWGVCLVPGAVNALGAALRELDPRASVTIVVGPEGGLSPAEIAACEAQGWASAGLGPLVLRTETVCAAVLGALLILGLPRLPA
jgi:16S rRNA (uracil1498-N3)-methyltransferase